MVSTVLLPAPRDASETFFMLLNKFKMLLLLAEQYPTVQVKILHSVTVFFSFFFFFFLKMACGQTRIGSLDRYGKGGLDW